MTLLWEVVRASWDVGDPGSYYLVVPAPLESCPPLHGLNDLLLPPLNPNCRKKAQKLEVVLIVFTNILLTKFDIWPHPAAAWEARNRSFYFDVYVSG